jgi:hypothetical protein
MLANEKTDSGNFVIAAFAGSKSDSTKGYFLKLNSDLDVSNPLVEKEITYETNSINRLYSIEPTSDGYYVVVGSTVDGSGFMAKVNSDGITSFEQKYSKVGAIRDVVERQGEDGYILVSSDGSVVKTDGNGAQLKLINLADDLRSVTQSADGNYLVAGRKDNDAYVAKLADNLAKVDRIQ